MSTISEAKKTSHSPGYSLVRKDETLSSSSSWTEDISAARKQITLASSPKKRSSETKRVSERLADREHWVTAQRLVDEHASDAHHRSATVVALSVQLPRLAQKKLLLSDLLGGPITEPHVVAIGVAGPQPAL